MFLYIEFKNEHDFVYDTSLSCKIAFLKPNFNPFNLKQYATIAVPFSRVAWGWGEQDRINCLVENYVHFICRQIYLGRGPTEVLCAIHKILYFSV